MSEFSVHCPHCGADEGHYTDFVNGLGSYYVVEECWKCEKPYRVEFEMRFSVSEATPEDLEGEQ